MTLTEYFESFLGTPYIWGAKIPPAGSTDCSGFVSWCFHRYGLMELGSNAQNIYRIWHSKGTSLSEPKEASLCFYGKSVNDIDHVAYALNKFMVIESGGGNAATTTVKIANASGACVRVSPFLHRADLVAIIHPNYNGINGILY